MRRVAVGLVLCVLASGVGAQAPQGGPLVPAVSAEPQGEASGNKPGAQPQNAAPPSVIVNVQPPTKTEAEAEDEKRERREKANLDRRLVELTGDLADYTLWLAFATAALFVVTVGLFYIALRQSRDAKEAGRAATISAEASKASAETAKVMSEINNRPRIRLRNAVIDQEIKIEKGATISGEFEALNYGNSDAYILLSHVEVYWSDRGLPAKRLLNTPGYVLNNPFNPNNIPDGVRAILPPSERIVGRFKAKTPLGPEADLINKSSNLDGIRLYIYGFISVGTGPNPADRRIWHRDFALVYNPLTGRFLPVKDDPDYEYDP